MIFPLLIFVSYRAPKIQIIPVASQQRNCRPLPYFIQTFLCSLNVTFQKTQIFSSTLENLTALRQSVDINWRRNLAHVFCVYLPVLACSGPSRLITPCLDCIMGRGLGFLCWQGGKEAMSATDSPRTDWRSGMKLRAYVSSRTEMSCEKWLGQIVLHCSVIWVLYHLRHA